MIARLQVDHWLRLDTVVHDERQRITVTEGRTAPCAQSGNSGSISGSSAISTLSPSWSPQIRKAKVMRRWQDGEHIAGIAPQHDCLGQTIPRNPTSLGGTCGRHGSVMQDHIVLDVFRSQVSLECGSYGHDGPPLRLTSLASLLTAPGEERSREIRRIAVTYRRAGLLLWGIRVRLHHLPIKVPGGMTEHRQNDSETDEEW